MAELGAVAAVREEDLDRATGDRGRVLDWVSIS